MLQLGFEQIVTTIPRRFIDNCRNVDSTRDERCRIFLSVLEGCALHPESSNGACGSGDDSVRIVGNSKSKALEFQKEYLKLIRELPRDTEIQSSRFSKESATNVAAPAGRVSA